MKKLVVAILCVATIISCLALASCGQCKHSYGEWSVAKEATCSVKGTEVRVCGECGATEEREIALLGHKYGEWVDVEGSTCLTGSKERVCSVCGHKETNNEAKGHVGGIFCDVCGDVTIDLNDIPVIEFAPESSLAVVLKDLEVDVTDEYYPTESGVFTLDIAELVLSLDENDEIVGYGHGALKLDAKNTDINNELKATVYVDGEELYIYVNGSGEITSTNQSKIYGKFDIAKLAEIAKNIEEAEAALTMAETYVPVIQSWLEESFLPLFENIEIAVDESAAEELAYKVLDFFFVPVNTDNGTKLTFSLENAKALNETLATKKISEIIDLAFGEGKYEEIKAAIPSILNFSVEDLIAWIENEGIDVDAVFAAADALVADILGDETATIEALIGLTDIDISEYIKKEEIKKLAVRDALIMVIGAVDDETTPDVNEAELELSQGIEAIFEAIETSTLYDIIASDEDAKGQIDEAIDKISEVISYSITYTKDGKVSCEVAITVEDGTITYVTSAKNGEISTEISINAEGSSVAFAAQVVVDYTPTVAKEDLAVSLDDIKAKVDTISITEDNFEDIMPGADPYYDENGELAGGVYYEEDEDTRFNPETYTYEFVTSEIEKTVYFDNIWACMVLEGCNGNYRISLMAFVDSYIVNTVVECDENGEPLEDAIPSIEEDSDFEGTNILFSYNYATGTVVEYDLHDYEPDDEQCVYGECEGYDKYVYVCENCGDSYVRYFYNNHSFVKTGVENGDIIFECNQDGCDDVYVCDVVINSDVELVPTDVLDDYNDLAYTFTIDEEGTYAIGVDFGQYVSIELKLDGEVLDFYDYDYETGADIYLLVAGEYTLELRTSDYANEVDGDMTVTIEKQ